MLSVLPWFPLGTFFLDILFFSDTFQESWFSFLWLDDACHLRKSPSGTRESTCTSNSKWLSFNSIKMICASIGEFS